MARRESKHLGGAFTVTTASLERPLDQLTLFGQRQIIELDAGRDERFVALRWVRLLPACRWLNLQPGLKDQRLSLDFFVIIERKRSLNHIFQFADVAGPMTLQ